MNYGNCLNHPNKIARNAKRLCDTCTKERHERAAASKGIITKSAKAKIEEDGTREIDSIVYAKKNNEANPATTNIKITSLRREQSCKVPTERFFEFANLSGKKKKAKTKIQPRSEKKKQEEAELARIKKQKIKELGKKCEMCPRHGSVDLFHIITVGDKKFSTNPTNLMLSCRFCHLVWGANDWGKIIKFKNFQEIMDRLKSLDEGQYWTLKHKIDEYYAKKSLIP